MKEIKLAKGKATLVDDEDYEKLNQFRWCAKWDGYNWYARRNTLENLQGVFLACSLIWENVKGFEIHQEFNVFPLKKRVRVSPSQLHGVQVTST